ncbi:serine/threonine-protein kinase [Streptomyces synnematoformans]|uniref:non-specific serine/threonine protein kinase n=1 Tax=Streptomyces synnematoformans TaxID=415721 RepID=A0ABP5J3B2_9ACTN
MAQADQKILERYELTHRLGAGGMGEVWAGYDKRLDRRVAVKFLRPHASPGTLRRLERRFMREARLTARLEHPGVPVLHDAGRLPDQRLYLVMQLVTGHTLATVLRRCERLPADWALAVTAQAADVLAHAHVGGVMHRDLKPANLMLTPTGTVKLLDFGIAAALDPEPHEPRLTAAGEMAPGTPGYIAPEQMLGHRATARSDLYALGCVLYQLLTGAEVFTGATPWVLFDRHLNDTPRPVTELVPQLPQEVAGLVTRLLAKNPDDRPASAERVAWEAAHLVARLHPAGNQAAEDIGAVIGSLPLPAGPTAATPDASWRPYDPTRPYIRVPPEPRPVPETAPERPPGGPAATAPVGPAEPLPESAAAQAQADRLAAEGRFSQAAALLEELLGKETGPAGRPIDDPWTVPVRLQLYDFLGKAGSLARARDGFAALGEALRRTRLTTDRDVLVCRAGEARSLAGLGQTTEALREYDRLLPDLVTAWGPAHETVFDVRYEAAALRAGAGEHRTARDLLMRLRDEQRAALPVADPRHAAVENLLIRLDRLLIQSRSTLP